MTLTERIASAGKTPLDLDVLAEAQSMSLDLSKIQHKTGESRTVELLYTFLLERKALLAQVEGRFIEGYICCLAGMVRSHGANTAEREAARQCGPADKIRKYASPDDIKDLEDAGCSID